MRQATVSTEAGRTAVWKESPFSGALLLAGVILAALTPTAVGCYFDDRADGPDGRPGTDAGPGPSDGGGPAPGSDSGTTPVPIDCTDPVAYWITAEVLPGESPDIMTTIANCTGLPLYVYADGCFDNVVRVERLHANGTIEEVGPAWVCAWGGPTDPTVVAPGTQAVLSNQTWAWSLAGNPGTYRFVYWLTYDFECPDPPAPGGPWPCAWDQPWVEVPTPSFVADY